MIPGLSKNLLGIVWLLLAVVAGTAAVRAEGQGPIYPAVSDPQAAVTAGVEAARASGRKALIILGANWCHDSIGLAEKLGDPAVAPILDAEYETVMIDVGPLGKARDVPQLYGRPTYYATPTVMVIDPETDRLVNGDTMDIWRDADKIAIADVAAYFADAAKATPPPLLDDPLLQRYLSEILAFETAVAERLVAAYDVIGPMVAMARTERPDNFLDYWSAVAAVRYDLTDQLARLRAAARQAAAAGNEGLELDFPTYEPFPWETAAD